VREEQLRRYARNIALSEVGIKGQEKLLAAKVLVIGAGGLGSPLLSYLAVAGVGTIGIIDYDRVELSNLQRQILFENSDIGRFKTQAAKDRLEEMNPDVNIILYSEKFKPENSNLISEYDIIADGSDNFATRFLVNAACLKYQKPLVSAAVRGFDGQIALFKPYLANQPCYRCLVSGEPDDERGCRDAGIIGALAGIIGSMQALEVIKEIVGIEQSLAGNMLILDGLTLNTRKVRIPKDPLCECWVMPKNIK